MRALFVFLCHGPYVVNRDPVLKHNPFASLRNLSANAKAPAAKTVPVEPQTTPLGRVVVREEFDNTENKVITRVIGVPNDRLGLLAKQCAKALDCTAMLEGKDIIVLSSEYERVITQLRDAAATEIVLVRSTRNKLATIGVAGGTIRSQVHRGKRVAVVQKADQESGTLTEGVVQDILTNSSEHPRGIKVRLESGIVGRVQRFLDS